MLLLSFALAGCASGPEKRPAGRHESMPTLSGRQTFFAEQITAEVKIGAMAGFPRDSAAPKVSIEKEGRRGRRGGGGFGGGMGGGPGMPPPGAGGPGEAGDGPRPTRALRGSPAGPPVMIHLRFTNHGTETVELQIADFLSPLGNFVVRPEKLMLAPGASAEVEPMASGLAREVAGGEVTLKLRLGSAVETKPVPLQVESLPGPGSGKTGQVL